jgi:hypothetical protein
MPAGSITAPLASANVNGSAVSISSNSSDAGSGVASAQFQRSPAGANTWTTISTDSSSPYAVNWDTTPLADGLYDLRVITTDNAGNTFTSSLVNNVRVDNTRPTVSMTAPTNNSYLRGSSVTISANANDGGSGLAGVQFKLDGVANIGSEDTSSPYSITWSTVGKTNGPHTLSAVARDSAGNTQTSTTISVTVDNQAPTVSVTAPLSGVTVSGSSVAISANASDNTSVAGVQFMLDCPGPACGSLGPEDTSSPYTYTWDTTSLANGPHTLSALARDVAGNTNTSSLVTVNVDNTTPPPTDTEEPSIPTGLHSTAKSISTISLAWDASTDNPGGSGVAGYKIYRDGNFVTSTTLLNYTDTGLDAGTTYDYTVSAYDNASNKSPESPVVSVATDSIPAPTVSLSAAPDTINSGDSSTLSWDSTDATDCVASGGWSGDKATSGSESTGALTAGQTYTLTCSGAGGIAQASTSVTVKDAPPPPPPPSFKMGDLNRDGHVDIFDLSILLTHYGSYGTPNQGDINQNQVIDIYDLSLLLTNYGK